MNIAEVMVERVGPGDYWVDGWHVVRIPGVAPPWRAARTCTCPQHAARYFRTFGDAKMWIGMDGGRA